MRYCPNCGAQAEGKFCQECGEKLPEVETPRPPVQQPTTSMPPVQQPVTSTPPVQPADEATAMGAAAPETKKRKLPGWVIPCALLGVAVVAAGAVILANRSGKKPDAPTVSTSETVRPTKTHEKGHDDDPVEDPTKASSADTDADIGTEPDDEHHSTEKETESTQTGGLAQSIGGLTSGKEVRHFTADNAFMLEGKVYVQEADGAYVFTEGERQAVYAKKDSIANNICTNGTMFYAVTEDHQVIRANANGTVETLFSMDGYFTVNVCGADKNHVYLALQEDEEAWWGCDVRAYDFSGKLVKDYGSGWDAKMNDGLLLLKGFRSDVSPMNMMLVDTDTGDCLLELSEELLVWDAEFYNGAVYCLTAPENFYESDYDAGLWAVDRNGVRTVGTYHMGDASSAAAGLDSGIMLIHDWDGEGVRTDFYYAETGEPVEIPEELKNADVYVNPRLDTEGQLFFRIDESIYRIDDEGHAYTAYIVPEANWSELMLSGDHYYYRAYDEDWNDLGTIGFALD